MKGKTLGARNELSFEVNYGSQRISTPYAIIRVKWPEDAQAPTLEVEYL